jgi:endo-alpha-1,4-polygalactosaminidase (GH114 family)
MTSPTPSVLRRLALVTGALLLAATVAPSHALAQGAPKAAQKGAPKAAAGTGQQPAPGVRQQGQEVPMGQPSLPSPNDEITTDPRQRMRNLVSDISAYARAANPDFVVVTYDGLDLLEKVDPVDPAKRAAAATYLKSIDAVIAPELSFHPPNERGDIKTEDKMRDEMLRLLGIGQKGGLRVWTVDYAKDAAMASEAIKFSLSKSFIPVVSMNTDYRFNRIPPGRPLNENPNAVTGINHVKNVLMLTDTSAWDTQEEFALGSSATNYDAIVVDVFHRGRTALNARTISGLKYKKLGSRRMVFAYVDIGHADSARYYWKAGWQEGSPSFIAAPTNSNPDKYTVQYWDPMWRDIIFGNPNSYLYGILQQGFDGIVLDGVESFRFFEGEQ